MSFFGETLASAALLPTRPCASARGPDMRFNQAGGSGDRAVNQEKAEAERPVSETPHFSCPAQLTLSGGSC